MKDIIQKWINNNISNYDEFTINVDNKITPVDDGNLDMYDYINIYFKNIVDVPEFIHFEESKNYYYVCSFENCILKTLCFLPLNICHIKFSNTIIDNLSNFNIDTDLRDEFIVEFTNNSYINKGNEVIDYIPRIYITKCNNIRSLKGFPKNIKLLTIE